LIRERKKLLHGCGSIGAIAKQSIDRRPDQLAPRIVLYLRVPINSIQSGSQVQQVAADLQKLAVENG
jgi:hypothetical protein